MLWAETWFMSRYNTRVITKGLVCHSQHIFWRPGFLKAEWKQRSIRRTRVGLSQKKAECWGWAGAGVWDLAGWWAEKKENTPFVPKMSETGSQRYKPLSDVWGKLRLETTHTQETWNTKVKLNEGHQCVGREVQATTFYMSGQSGYRHSRELSQRESIQRATSLVSVQLCDSEASVKLLGCESSTLKSI